MTQMFSTTPMYSALHFTTHQILRCPNTCIQPASAEAAAAAHCHPTRGSSVMHSRSSLSRHTHATYNHYQRQPDPNAAAQGRPRCKWGPEKVLRCLEISTGLQANNCKQPNNRETNCHITTSSASTVQSLHAAHPFHHWSKLDAVCDHANGTRGRHRNHPHPACQCLCACLVATTVATTAVAPLLLVATTTAVATLTCRHNEAQVVSSPLFTTTRLRLQCRLHPTISGAPNLA